MRRTQVTDEARLPAPPERVLAALLDVDRYAEWWPAGIHIDVLERRPAGPGSAIRLGVMGARFTVRVAEVGPRRVVMEYVDGVHRGTGTWTLEPDGAGGTRAAYEVDLEPQGWLVRLLSHVLDYGRMHSKLMANVFAGLARHLEGR